MIEDKLVELGVLGLWTASLVVERYGTQKKMMEIMQEVRDLLKRRNV